MSNLVSMQASKTISSFSIAKTCCIRTRRRGRAQRLIITQSPLTFMTLKTQKQHQLSSCWYCRLRDTFNRLSIRRVLVISRAIFSEKYVIYRSIYSFQYRHRAIGTVTRDLEMSRRVSRCANKFMFPLVRVAQVKSISQSWHRLHKTTFFCCSWPSNEGSVETFYF